MTNGFENILLEMISTRTRSWTNYLKGVFRGYADLSFCPFDSESWEYFICSPKCPFKNSYSLDFIALQHFSPVWKKTTLLLLLNSSNCLGCSGTNKSVLAIFLTQSILMLVTDFQTVCYPTPTTVSLRYSPKLLLIPNLVSHLCLFILPSRCARTTIFSILHGHMSIARY